MFPELESNPSSYPGSVLGILGFCWLYFCRVPSLCCFLFLFAVSKPGGQVRDLGLQQQKQDVQQTKVPVFIMIIVDNLGKEAQLRSSPGASGSLAIPIRSVSSAQAQQPSLPSWGHPWGAEWCWRPCTTLAWPPPQLGCALLPLAAFLWHMDVELPSSSPLAPSLGFH